MSKSKEATKLFEMFPPVSTKAWKEKIMTDLKGADYNKKLVWRTQEGFDVEPFYREEDLEKLSYLLNCNPGEYPFVRGNRVHDNDWLVRQDIEASDINAANKKALEVLNKGVESLGFIFGEGQKIGKPEFEALLKDICLDAIEVNFISSHDSENITNLFLDYIQENYQGKEVRASVNFDPIGHFALYGKFYSDEQKLFAKAKSLIAKAKGAKGFKAINIHSNFFKNAGVTIAEELGITVAMGSEYLAKLTEDGVEPQDVNASMRFHFGVGVNYFMEIAKFRAARFMWAQVAEKYGVPKQACKMHIHAQTSTWGKSVYDPYVNTLRTTTEAMSAALGGVESLTVDPFNFYEKATVQSERIARNQQIILKEESYFKNVVDAAGGSYYIETLTDELIQEAWKVFLKIESEGGFIASYRKGEFQKRMADTVKQRSTSIALRKETFLGSNDFPNFEETQEDRPAELFEAKDNTVENAETQGLVTYRGPQEFERMRYRTDTWAKNHKRPVAFMFTYGNLAMRLARSQFSQNFFAIGGFKTIDNHGFNSVEEGIKAAIEKEADIVVLCSSDDEYPNIAPEAIKALNGKATVVVAGYPKNAVEELEAAGVEHFIHVKSNVLETLENFQKQLGLM
ncbi:MAG: methylmalonyl-CoA mutase family protein [Salinivirgaceae bacterium]|jgi:methylmalonyl-CoA mutase|nr:methylmalonyl-CoA mutase family protein [Salinivirgaceae bacterium]